MTYKVLYIEHQRKLNAVEEVSTEVDQLPQTITALQSTGATILLVMRSNEPF